MGVRPVGMYRRQTSVAEMDAVLRRYAAAPQRRYPELAVRLRWARVNGVAGDFAACEAAFSARYRRICAEFDGDVTPRTRHLRLVTATG